MAHLTATLLSCVVLAVCWTSCIAMNVDTCNKVEPCLGVFEGTCSNGGKRQVCLTYKEADANCVTALGGTATGAIGLPAGGAFTPGTGGTATQLVDGGLCVSGDFASFNPTSNAVVGVSPAHSSTRDVTRPWHSSVQFCVMADAGTMLMWGLRDPPSGGYTSVDPGNRLMTVEGKSMMCEGYTKVCDQGSNLDIKLTYNVTACTTNPPPPSCDGCSSSPTPCTVSCGTGSTTTTTTCPDTSCSLHNRQITNQCTLQACPTPTWSNWGGCSASCRSSGIRTRMCVGGATCPGLGSEPCNLNVPCGNSGGSRGRRRRNNRRKKNKRKNKKNKKCTRRRKKNGKC